MHLTTNVGRQSAGTAVGAGQVSSTSERADWRNGSDRAARTAVGCFAALRVAVAIRNATFDWGFRKSRRVAVPVISIGNITTGGTGKTPFVALVTEILQQSGNRPGIISRGYGADASGENDEKRVLDRLNPGVPHLQNPSRVSSAQTLIESGSVDSLVMDDGFQHRSLGRDLDIVLIDACNPFGLIDCCREVCCENLPVHCVARTVC